jgi:ABC-type transport system involved in multi-copper enzyme maturation permease subunit
MNAPATVPSFSGLRRPAPAIGNEHLVGLGNYTRKDAAEWIKTKRAFWTAVVAQALMLLGALAMRGYATIQPGGQGINLDPSFNMANVGWETNVPLLVVFATMGMLAAERSSRTLAWSLSMPLNRTSVLVSKLLTNIAALGLLAAILPLATTLIAIRLAYGAFPDAASVFLPWLTGIAIGIYLLVLNLASNVFFKSQASATGIAVVTALVIPGLIQTLWQAASPWWPISIEFWIKGLGKNEPVNWITPVVYVVTMVVLLIAARARFARDEV